MHEMDQMDRKADTSQSVETHDVMTTVIALVPEFHQAKVRTADGHLYAITERTPGIRLQSLREGQHVRCTVSRRLPRVLAAELIA
jgi:hypothetical protein